MSHFLDPEHLTNVHVMTLPGMRLGKILSLDDNQAHPSMTFEVASGKNIAQTTLTILGPFDVEMAVAEKNMRMNILFSANPRSETNELQVGLFTNDRLAGLLLAPVSGLTFFEDLGYLKQTERFIDDIFQQRQGGFRALFDIYRDRYDRHLDDLIHQATVPSARQYGEIITRQHCALKISARCRINLTAIAFVKASPAVSVIWPNVINLVPEFCIRNL